MGLWKGKKLIADKTSTYNKNHFVICNSSKSDIVKTVLIRDFDFDVQYYNEHLEKLSGTKIRVQFSNGHDVQTLKGCAEISINPTNSSSSWSIDDTAKYVYSNYPTLQVEVNESSNKLNAFPIMLGNEFVGENFCREGQIFDLVFTHSMPIAPKLMNGVDGGIIQAETTPAWCITNSETIYDTRQDDSIISMLRTTRGLIEYQRDAVNDKIVFLNLTSRNSYFSALVDDSFTTKINRVSVSVTANPSTSNRSVFCDFYFDVPIGTRIFGKVSATFDVRYSSSGSTKDIARETITFATNVDGYVVTSKSIRVEGSKIYQTGLIVDPYSASVSNNLIYRKIDITDVVG